MYSARDDRSRSASRSLSRMSKVSWSTRMVRFIGLLAIFWEKSYEIISGSCCFAAFRAASRCRFQSSIFCISIAKQDSQHPWLTRASGSLLVRIVVLQYEQTTIGPSYKKDSGCIGSLGGKIIKKLLSTSRQPSYRTALLRRAKTA